MGIQCQSLLKIPSLRKIKILAGHEGLSRIVRWVYVWDILSDISDITNWIYGNELVIVSEHMLDGDFEMLLKVIPKLNNFNVSGVIINAKEKDVKVPQTIIDEANKFGLPLFSLPWSEKIINITHDVCYLLAQEEIREKAKSDILEKILFDVQFDKENVMDLAYRRGYEISSENIICVVEITKDTIMSKQKKRDINNDVLEFIQTNIKSAFASRNVKILTVTRNERIVLLVPFNKQTNAVIREVFKHIYLICSTRFKGFTLRVGCGNAYKDLKDMSKSYQQAGYAIKYIKVEKREQIVAHYEDLGIYSLLMEIKDQELLKAYYYHAVGSIIEYDKSNNSELMNTLKTFFDYNMDVHLAANAMFIHKNTMRYRIAKIQELLKYDMKEMHDVILLSTAIKTGQLLSMETNNMD